MLNNLLKNYDKYLDCKKNLDGSIIIFRKSPYSSMKFDILTIDNQYCGSCKWILKKIILMDSRRKDFFMSAIEKNKKLRKKPNDNRMTKEIADHLVNGGFVFIN